MKSTDNELAADIVRDSRIVFTEVFLSGKYNNSKPDVRALALAGCIYQAVCVIYAAGHHGVRLVLQAGSASYYRGGGGVGDTHFGYQWDGRGAPAVEARIRAGLMPEMHVWAGRVDTQEVVDITTTTLVERCELAGLPWESGLPPSFVWRPFRMLPPGWEYESEMGACLWAFSQAEDWLRLVCAVDPLHRDFHRRIIVMV